MEQQQHSPPSSQQGPNGGAERVNAREEDVEVELVVEDPRDVATEKVYLQGRNDGRTNRGPRGRKNANALLSRHEGDEDMVPLTISKRGVASLLAVLLALLLAKRVISIEKRLSKEEAAMEAETEQLETATTAGAKLREAQQREDLAAETARQELDAIEKQDRQNVALLKILEEKKQAAEKGKERAKLPIDEQVDEALRAARARLTAALDAKADAEASLEAIGEVENLTEEQAQVLLANIQDDITDAERVANRLEAGLSRGRKAKTAFGVEQALRNMLGAMEKEMEAVEDEVHDWQEEIELTREKLLLETTAIDEELEDLKEVQTVLEERRDNVEQALQQCAAEKAAVMKEIDETEQQLQDGVELLVKLQNLPKVYKRREEMLKKAAELQEQLKDEIEELIGVTLGKGSAEGAAKEEGSSTSDGLGGLFPEEAQLVKLKQQLVYLNRRKEETELELAALSDEKEKAQLAKALGALIVQQADYEVDAFVDLEEEEPTDGDATQKEQTEGEGSTQQEQTQQNASTPAPDDNAAPAAPAADDAAAKESSTAKGDGASGAAAADDVDVAVRAGKSEESGEKEEQEQEEEEETISEAMLKAQEDVALARHRLHDVAEKRRRLERDLLFIKAQIDKTEKQIEYYQRLVDRLKGFLEDRVKHAPAHAMARTEAMESKIGNIEKALRRLQKNAKKIYDQAAKALASATDLVAEQQEQQRICQAADDAILLALSALFEELSEMRLAGRLATDDLLYLREKEMLMAPTVFGVLLQQAAMEGPSCKEQKEVAEAWVDRVEAEREELRVQLQRSIDFEEQLEEWLIAVEEAATVDLLNIRTDVMNALSALAKERANKKFCEARLKAIEHLTQGYIESAVDSLFTEALRERGRREAMYGLDMEVAEGIHEASKEAISEEASRLRGLCKMAASLEEKYSPLHAVEFLQSPGKPRKVRKVPFPEGSSRRFAGELVDERPKPTSTKIFSDGSTGETHEGVLQLGRKGKGITSSNENTHTPEASTETREEEDTQEEVKEDKEGEEDKEDKEENASTEESV
ncbi:hypothetical protein, conserved [Eimeria acervulina]|uniref:Uncharacterized protein n=1 Tax=Eimeria acervulina TaxID=5801 RepID=U6GM10_EIMAC|nr:hypothetical protein, conserved [Eimeria acervulina]CDI81215.1 hypothetical protein, conserved [Eimeria acervulina]